MARDDEPLEGTIIDPERPDQQDGAASEEPLIIDLGEHEYGAPRRRARTKRRLGDDGAPFTQQSAPGAGSAGTPGPGGEQQQSERPRRSLFDDQPTAEGQPAEDPQPESEGTSSSARARFFSNAFEEDFAADAFGYDDPWAFEARRRAAQRDARSRNRSSYLVDGMTYLDDGLVDTGDPQRDLEINIQNAGQSFMSGLVESTYKDAVSATKKADRRALYENMSAKHKVYTMMMGLSCLQGLRNGVTPSAVIGSATMAGTMWALSPNFRNVIGGMVGPKLEPTIDKLKGAVENHIAGRRVKEGAKIDRKLARADAKGVPLSERWTRRLNRLQEAEAGHVPFSAQSAAMAEMGIKEAYFRILRTPGMDEEALASHRDNQTFLLKNLYDQAAGDGVPAEEIARAARVLVGHRIEDNPVAATMYTELAYGDLHRSVPREVVVDAEGTTAHIWDGGFDNDFGQKVVSGSFTTRDVMSSDEHQVAMARSMAGDMLTSSSLEEFNMAMFGYGAGVKMYPTEQGEQFLNPGVASRMRRARLFHACMGADGADQDEIEKVYSNAYLDALEIVRGREPEIEQRWVQQYGEAWQERFKEFMDDPVGTMQRDHDARTASGASDQREPFVPEPPRHDSGRSQGPDTPEHASASGRYRRARTNQGYNTVDTGRIAGFGVDDYDPGADFQLGG